ncbi:MAG: NUDIX hydrolase [Sporichthyaceae bacterium]
MSPEPREEFCRRCGSPTARRVPPGDNRLRAVCDGCGNVEYDNPKVVVACPIYAGDRVLWLRRTHPPYAGSWAIPAGFVELGETLAEAATREVLEETRLHIGPDDWTLCGVLSLPDINQVYVGLAAPLPNHDYGPTAEAAEVEMLTRGEALSRSIAYPSPTAELFLKVYDAIADADWGRVAGWVWDIRGRDPRAFP